MANQWDESTFNEQAIGDIETARLALRWALDKIKYLQEDNLKFKQNVQEKNSQINFLENQLKNKNGEIEKLFKSHDEEMKSNHSSLEYQFKAKLERLSEREKEVEERIARQENDFKDKESKLLEDYQKKSDELRGRWSNIESELWQLRQEQILKQQEYEKIYGGKLEDEKHNLSEETNSLKESLEKNYEIKLRELEKREYTLREELKKQEAVFKWAKDSWQKEVDEREKKLKVKELEIEKKLLEKNQEIDDSKVRVGLLEKQIRDLPDALKKRDEDIDRYRSSLESLEGVIKTLEDEKKNLTESYESKNAALSNSLEAEKSRYKDLEIEIPKRLKIAIEHERARFHDKLSEIEYNYKEDVRKKQEETDYLSNNLKTFEGTIKALQDERNNFSQKIETLQGQRDIKNDEHSFREKQLQSEFEIRLKVELEKNMLGLKHEIDTAQRIYSDNLKLKVEEISHLRKELETLSVDKVSLKDQVSGMRRNIDALNEKHGEEILFIKAKEKDDYKAKLIEKADEMGKTYNAEKTKLQSDFERQLDNINAILAGREEEILRFKLALQKSEEEKKVLILEERQKIKFDLDLQEKTFRDTAKLYEDKIVQLSKNIEAVRLEKEEALLLDRDRTEKICTEKEKVLDERLSAKDEEIARLREDLIHTKHDKESTLGQFVKERDELLLLERGRAERIFTEKEKGLKEELSDREAEVVLLREEALHAKHNKEIILGQFAKEREELKKRIFELTDKYSQSETEHHAKLENIIKREAEKFHNALDKKESEMAAMKLIKENQEESYRKSLENFRSKLSDAVGKLETIKHVADDRQNQIVSLHMEMTEAKKNYEHEIMSLKNKADDYHKQLREVKGEYEEQKNNFAVYSDESQKRMNDAMIKLRKTEERFKGIADKLDEARREIELKRIESDKKEECVRQLESEVENQKNDSLRVIEEFRRKEKIHKGELENLQAGINHRESIIAQLNNAAKDKNVIMAEMNALEEKLASKEMAVERLNSELKNTAEKLGTYKSDLTESLNRIKETKDAYNKATNENEELKNNLDVFTAKYNRARYMYESEKKKKEEIDVLAQTSSSALREKEEENQNLKRTLERVKEDLALNFKLMKEKDEAIEYLSTEMSNLHKLKKEYIQGRKVIDQLKERIKLWKKS
ncbi:MAG: hypothetical protein L6420_08700 [Elusimicrobia bacterium]|nr:hypothetical protein [Elusimicrobiota bacterium]